MRHNIGWCTIVLLVLTSSDSQKNNAALVSSVVNDISSDDATKPQFLYYGIVGMQTAQSIDSLSNAITDLTAKIKTGETGGVYVHCGGGVGRAGLVCASVLGALYPTISADEAMEYHGTMLLEM